MSWEAVADIDASSGISTDYNQPWSYTGMTVKNVTVENVYFRGIQYADGNDYGTGTIDFENDTVTNVQADPSSVAIFNFGGSGIIQGNHVSYANDAISANWSAGTQFLDNVVTNSASWHPQRQ